MHHVVVIFSAAEVRGHSSPRELWHPPPGKFILSEAQNKKKKNVLENEVALVKFASHTFNFLLCNFLHRVDLYFPVD